jgi:TRAP transporter 4TM/12TM fusion protein
LGVLLPLLQRSGFLTTADLAVGTILIILVFEAARRLMGLPLSIVAGVFLLYCFLGQYLPDPLVHRGYSFDQIVDTFAFGTEGIYGTPIYVSAAYIFIFVVFAAFLERAGMINLFNDFALGLVGGFRGGPAQVCILSSALMGTISGSGVANVVASGQFTIPLMKKFGFRAAFAGGVEATSSMGGQIMPPVMGAVAFIMAETLNVAYAEIVKAAIIPAVLYFGACAWMVYLESGKAGLKGMDKAGLPNPLDALRSNWPLVLPLAALVYLLFAGYTPIFAGTMGLALTIVLVLGMPIAALIGPLAFRFVFWIVLGLAAAAFLKFGVNVLVLVLAALVLACLSFNGGRQTLVLCRDALAEGAKNALPVGIACAVVGVIIGTLTLTGIASTFVGAIIDIGENSLFLSLLLTMLTCLVLGMGIPTIANYIITSSLAGPALLALGVPLIVSHMFVFYFGIMADLTPPVALAAFAAAPMAKVSGMKIGVQASKLAVAGFVVPFMAVYTPALMLQDPGPMAAVLGYPAEVAYVFLKTCLAIGLWGMAVVGYLAMRAAAWERILAIIAAASLVAALPITDELGFALAGLIIIQHLWRALRVHHPAVTS